MTENGTARTTGTKRPICPSQLLKKIKKMIKKMIKKIKKMIKPIQKTTIAGSG